MAWINGIRNYGGGTGAIPTFHMTGKARFSGGGNRVVGMTAERCACGQKASPALVGDTPRECAAADG